MRKILKKLKTHSDVKRYRRRLSIRSKINGSSDRPRICAKKSNKNLSVQIIDDVAQKTLFSVQTFGKNAVPGSANTTEGAKVLGTKIAEMLKKNNIEKAVFDRAGYKYTGKLTILVDAIRESGIQV